MTILVTGALSPGLRCIIYASYIECPPIRMDRQLILTLVADDSQRIAAAAGDIQPALIEMLRAYFHDILSEEKINDDGKDHREP